MGRRGAARRVMSMDQHESHRRTSLCLYEPDEIDTGGPSDRRDPESYPVSGSCESRERLALQTTPRHIKEANHRSLPRPERAVHRECTALGIAAYAADPECCVSCWARNVDR